MKRFIILFSMLFVVVVGCSDKATIETITDPHTQPTIEYVESQKNMMVYDHRSDNMDRGDYHYYKKDIIIDPEYYLTQDVKRGEVVFYERPEAYYDWLEERKAKLKEQGEDFEPEPVPESIARVVALSSETIEIKNGQIYIDGKELDAFYGDITQNPRSTDSDKEYNMEAIEVPEGHVFVMGDLLWRSIDSTLYGPIPIDNIIGKVKGYQK